MNKVVKYFHQCWYNCLLAFTVLQLSYFYVKHTRVIRNIFGNEILCVVTENKCLKSSCMLTLFNDPIINIV